jgi:hypothetical protein
MLPNAFDNQALCHRPVAYRPKFAVIVVNGCRIAGSSGEYRGSQQNGRGAIMRLWIFKVNRDKDPCRRQNPRRL